MPDIDKTKIKSILLVCTGNSCRSIMAEGYLAKRLDNIGKDISVASAGTGAMSGFKPTPEAIASMKEINVDVSDYKSTALSKEAIENADIILVMAPMHKEAILAMNPYAKDKVFYLREFANKSPEDKFIPDPIGKPLEFYRKTLNSIIESVEGFVKWLES